jgi:gliding motility-associated-like protein
LNAPPILNIDTITTLPTACSGPTGVAQVTASGGVLPYSYDWSDGVSIIGNTARIGNLPAGIYTVMITDANSCTVTATVRITLAPNPPPPAIPAVQNVCIGDTLWLRTTTLSAGYLWSNSIGTFSSTQRDTFIYPVTSADAGWYTLTITDFLGCTSTSTMLVTVNPTPPRPFVIGDTVCLGDNVQLIAIPPFVLTYWRSPLGDTIITTGNLDLAATDSNYVSGNWTAWSVDTVTGCASANSSPAFLQIDSFPSNITISNTSPVCYNQSAILRATAPNPYIYIWSSDSLRSDTLAIGNTYVTPPIISDTLVYLHTLTGAGCDTIQAVPIRVNPPTTVIINTSNTQLCAGDALNLIASFNSTYSYVWTSPIGIVSTSYTVQISNIQAGYTGWFRVTATAPNGCIATDSVFVTVNNNPPTPILVQLPSCAGDSLRLSHNGSCDSSIWQGPTGRIYVTASNVLAIDSSNADYQDGIWTVRCFDGNTGCASLSNPILVRLPRARISNGILATSPVCYGDSAFWQTTPILGVGNYNWYNATGTVSINGLQAGLANITSDTILYLEVQENGCTYTIDSAQVRVRPIPPAPTIIGNTQWCEGDDLSLTTNRLAVGYIWTTPSGISNSGRSLFIPSITSADAGWYTLVAITPSGCTTAVDSILIQIQARPTAPTIISSSSVCGTDSLILEATASCSNVVWTAPDGQQWTGSRIAFAPNAQGYLSGTWRVACGATAISCSSLPDSIVINIQTPPTPTITATNPVCKGDTIAINTNNGMFGTIWYRDAALTDTAGTSSILTVNNIQADSTYYAVHIAAANGCASFPASVTLLVLPSIVLDAGPDQTLCEEEDLFLSTTNAFSAYSWTGPSWSGSNSRSPIVSDVDLSDTGDYIVQATDVNGCVFSDTVNVVVIPLPIEPIVAPFQQICATDTLFLSPDALFSQCDSMYWEGPNGQIIGGSHVQILPTDIANFVAGEWELYCLDTTTNCSSQSNEQRVVIITPPSPPSITHQNTVCVGGAITLNASTSPGIINYYWYANSNLDSIIATGPSPTINNITSDTVFYLIVENGGGCLSSVVSTLVTAAPPTNTPNIIANPNYCEGDVVILTSNTAAISYQWAGPSGFSAAGPSVVVSQLATSNLSGVYTLTTRDSLGCISLMNSIPITIHPPASAAQLSTNAPICEGEDLRLWSNGSCSIYEWVTPLGNSILSARDTLVLTTLDSNYQSGNWYSICIDTVTGCRVNSDTINITIEPQPVLLGTANNGPVCLGQSVQLSATIGNLASLTWYSDPALQTVIPSSFVPTANQWVYAKASNSLGCSVVDSTYVEVYPPIVGNMIARIDTLCEGDDLILNSPLWINQYQWTGPNGYSSTLQQPTVLLASASTAGQYFLTVTDQNGCTRTDSIEVVVNPLPIPPSLASVGIVCAGDNFTLSTPNIAGYTYQWIRWPQGTVVSTTNSYTVVSSTTADSGRYYVEVSNGDCAVASLDTVLVDIINPSLVNVFAGADQQLCGQSSAVLTATGLPSGYIGTWTSNNSSVIIGQTTSSTTTVSNLPLGTTTFYWTASYSNCNYQQTDSTQITILSLGTDTAYAGVDQTICLPASVQLNATNTAASIGMWNQSAWQANSGVVINNPSQANTGISGLVAGQSYDFVWSINRAGCPVHSSDTVTIVVGATPLVAVYAGEDIYTCGEDTVWLNATAVVNGTWSSNHNLTFGDSTQASTWVTGWNNDTTVVYWSLSGGICRNFSQDSLLIISTPINIIAEPDVFAVVAGQSEPIYVLNNDQWSDNWDIFIYSPLPNGQVSNQNNGWFDVTAPEGDSLQYFVYELCATECPAICDTALVSLQVDGMGDCDPPNIFTPNGDGVNDYFSIPCLDIAPRAYLAVFNRWGDQVYESDRYGNQWDGRHNGQALPDGTYFYILKIDNQAAVQGSVEIRR